MKKCLLVLCCLISFVSCQQSGVTEQPIDFCSGIHKKDSVKLSSLLLPYAAKMKSKTGVYVLEDGGGAIVARAWLCENAEKSIDIQYFIFSTDNVGLIACDYLVRAADRGVKVRILIDDILIDATPEEVLNLDSHHNISIKVYNPGINLGKNILGKLSKFATDFKVANQRMYNKTFIVDGKLVITGGRNIACEYFDYDHEYNFRDRDVFLMGKTSENVQTSFNDFWESNLSVPVLKIVSSEKIDLKDKFRFKKLHQYACNPENFWPQVRFRIQELPKTFKSIQESGNLFWLDSVNFVSDIPGKNINKGLKGGGLTTDALIDLVNKATKTIDIQSPYFITTDVGKKVFKAAIDRGVKIRILTNSLASTDNIEAFNGYQRDREKLLNLGIEIYEFKPDAACRFKTMTGALQTKLKFTPIFGLHAKGMVVDGRITVIGTFNLDPRSANLNTECVTILYSTELAKNVMLGFEDEFKTENSWHTTLDFNPDNESSIYKRAKTWTRKAIPKSIL
jgi:phosphatidylserine/phosphatidylglycerophosphate/cardiolipin synthase-like enzyme